MPSATLAPARFANAAALPPGALLAELRALPFADFARTVATLLERLGYRDVRLMGPLHAKGRNTCGGFDLRATMGELAGVTVLAQVKQYREPVPRSFVDELRGTLLRQGAQQGLLISTSEFAPAALEAAQSGQHALPVRLVAGDELAQLIAMHKVPLGERAWSAFVRPTLFPRAVPGRTSRSASASSSPGPRATWGVLPPSRTTTVETAPGKGVTGLTVTVTVSPSGQAGRKPGSP